MLGMGLAHMVFGGGGFGGGGFGLMHLLLLGGLVYFGMRFWRARQAAQGNYGAFPQAGATANPMRGFAGNFMGSAVDTGTPLMLADTDTEAFAQTLVSIQTAWGDGNFDKLRQYVTPEMLHYFNDELAANTSRGVENKVANVTVQDVQAVESWQEYNLSYATVVIRWTASDYMVRLGRQPADSDYIASGNPAASETFSEQWTFNRAQGGRWLLSAIQQVV
jgi:predicted lipid-binding transport protein (Tim44 family)